MTIFCLLANHFFEFLFVALLPPADECVAYFLLPNTKTDLAVGTDRSNDISGVRKWSLGATSSKHGWCLLATDARRPPLTDRSFSRNSRERRIGNCFLPSDNRDKSNKPEFIFFDGSPKRVHKTRNTKKRKGREALGRPNLLNRGWGSKQAISEITATRETTALHLITAKRLKNQPRRAWLYD